MREISREQMQELLAVPIFHQIGETADEIGLECYLVGGYVRDLFLERLSKDIDCVVVNPSACSPEGEGHASVTPGISLAQALKQKLGRKAHLSVFKNFGTAQLKVSPVPRGESLEVEFVGARRESYSRDSRKPIVEDGTLEDDLSRRDFTINALAVCLNANRFGELIDRFDGLLDMEDRLIATPLDPDITFSDDPLRMMRCVRFATQLHFQIEEETQEALVRNAERIKIISQERIIDEINKIMLSPRPSIGFVELDRAGLLPIIFPELAALQGVEVRNGRGHKDNFYHTLEVLDNVAQKTATHCEGPVQNDAQTNSALCTSNSELEKSVLFLRWAALLHDIGKPKSKRWDPLAGWTFKNHNYIGQKMVSSIFHRMKLPLDERMHYVERLVGLHMRPIAIADDEVTDSAVRRLLFEAGPDIDDLMLLCEADITTGNADRKQQFLHNFQLVREKLADLQARDNYRTWTNPITGEEIMETFGIGPCRQIGDLKQAIKDAIWESRIPNDHDAAYQFMLAEAEKMGLVPVKNI
ncbi:MAG: HD domain-containing protein [Bacteroidaceae bacterium]|nr:HD domain-containing protein [Bacteroidaceae bacterium]